jgi:sialate O-acetylesterase
MKVEGNAIRIRFTHADGGLVAKDGPLKWFQVAGADGQFVDAEATIDGKTIVVKSEKVPAPAAVRYAWSNYPFGCNLYNAAGLPAAPFRTDAWDAMTEVAKEFTGK